MARPSSHISCACYQVDDAIDGFEGTAEMVDLALIIGGNDIPPPPSFLLRGVIVMLGNDARTTMVGLPGEEEDVAEVGGGVWPSSVVTNGDCDGLCPLACAWSKRDRDFDLLMKTDCVVDEEGVGAVDPPPTPPATTWGCEACEERDDS